MPHHERLAAETSAKCHSTDSPRAGSPGKNAPKEGELFDLEDVRKDAECTDTVGIHVRMEDGGRARFAVSLGPKVQTLTRALAVILCRGLGGCTLQEVVETPPDFVPRVIGAELVRLRSQTVYYVLRRMQEAARTLLWRASTEAHSAAAGA